MKKNGFVLMAILIILIPLAVITAGSNAALRLPVTYHFYFNDRQPISRAGYNLEPEKTGTEIAKYLNGAGGKFQLYEENGRYRDPVFDKKDQQVFRRVQAMVMRQGILALILLIAAVALFLLMGKMDLEEFRQFGANVGCGAAGVLTLAHIVLVGISGFRKWIYGALIGISLPKDSALVLLMSYGLPKAYLLTSTVAMAVLIIALLAWNYTVSRPKDTVFY